MEIKIVASEIYFTFSRKHTSCTSKATAENPLYKFWKNL